MERSVAYSIGLSGSLRKASYNTALLRAAADLLPHGSALSVRTIRGMPLYDADAVEGIPLAVADLKEAMFDDDLHFTDEKTREQLRQFVRGFVDFASSP